jgi:hypothetical protein
MICCVVIVCADVGVNVAGVRLCECSCVRSVNYFVVCEFVCSFRFPSPYKLSRDRKKYSRIHDQGRGAEHECVTKHDTSP